MVQKSYTLSILVPYPTSHKNDEVLFQSSRFIKLLVHKNCPTEESTFSGVGLFRGRKDTSWLAPPVGKNGH